MLTSAIRIVPSLKRLEHDGPGEGARVSRPRGLRGRTSRARTSNEAARREGAGAHAVAARDLRVERLRGARERRPLGESVVPREERRVMVGRYRAVEAREDAPRHRDVVVPAARVAHARAAEAYAQGAVAEQAAEARLQRRRVDVPDGAPRGERLHHGVVAGREGAAGG